MEINELSELEYESKQRGIPIIGSEKGKWLLDKVKKLQPKRILELGTANGYSGIILGSEGGELTTIDQDDIIVQEAENNFKDFFINYDIIIGNGIDEIKKLNEKFDLIFIDFAKKNYIEVLGDCIRLCRINGLIIADNINIESCADFREEVMNHPKLKTEIIHINDGMSCSKK